MVSDLLIDYAHLSFVKFPSFLMYLSLCFQFSFVIDVLFCVGFLLFLNDVCCN